MPEELHKQGLSTGTVVTPPTKPLNANYSVSVFLPSSSWVLSYETDKVWMEKQWLCFIDKATGNKVSVSVGSTVVITGEKNFPITDSSNL